jgi:hypothetical protein
MEATKLLKLAWLLKEKQLETGIPHLHSHFLPTTRIPTENPVEVGWSPYSYKTLGIFLRRKRLNSLRT